MNRLIYNGKTYDDVTQGGDKLMSANCFIGDSLTADQLAVDTLTAVVRDYDLETRILAADGLPMAAGGLLLVTKRDRYGLNRYSYGQEVRYYHGNVLIGKFYLESILRIGKNEYQFNCISAVGLLITDYHYGGMYTGQTMAEVVADIVNGIVPYTLDTTLGNAPMYGLLKKGTRRDNLRDVLFAEGGQVRKDTAGTLNIVPMSTGTPYKITVDEMYIGGNVTGGNPASEVQVTEHSYISLPTDEEITLFDGESAAEIMVTPKGKAVTGILVDFDEPIHDLKASNVEILESGANYAVLGQSPAALLTGLRYTHVERIISRKGKTSASPNIVRSKECTLVNVTNAENVADRVMAYYGSAKTIEADLVVTKQKPGDAVTFQDPFGDQTNGYIQSLDVTMSRILKGRATLIAGYIPPTSTGNYYQHVAVITVTQTFTFPAETKDKARIVLIGGGDGGEAGQEGTSGSSSSSGSPGSSGKGGAAGKGGSGGKIVVFALSVKAGQSFPVKIGTGGAGASPGGTPGVGGATTFGSYSSEGGFASNSGYADLINGTVYGTKGGDGIAGGDGQKSDFTRPTVTNGVTTWSAGSAGANAEREGGKAGGGLGGGAAVGADGANGGTGKVAYVIASKTVYAEGGKGGKGADAASVGNASVPGAGGPGGHGGGGGGGAGYASSPDGSTQEWHHAYGAGGSPSAGGSGANGVALVYY